MAWDLTDEDRAIIRAELPQQIAEAVEAVDMVAASMRDLGMDAEAIENIDWMVLELDQLRVDLLRQAKPPREPLITPPPGPEREK